ncbi:MAG TPA: flagellar protein FlgN [Steroidobacteraceae bacterium]|nr:flagellar protein FlgN [Steroidobacteraceae bacterium]
MEASVCRDKLGTLMAQETRSLTELAALLEKEHEYLLANDVVALEEAAHERQRCVARIAQADEERRSLCRELGRPDDPRGLEDLLRWCDPRGTLATGWAQCSAAAANCRSLNDRNGALVGARLKHVQERLGILIQGRREAVTYGARGAYAAAGTGRVLTTKA